MSRRDGAAGPEYRLSTVEDTRAFGVALAAVLRPGDLVLLDGPLGAGKTALAQGIGAGLGVTERVTSPTFVIARVHRGRIPLVHVDAYRLGATGDPRAEVDDLDLDASLDDAVTVVEWGHGRVEQLAEASLAVRIDRAEDDTRTVRLAARGGDWPDRLARLAVTRTTATRTTAPAAAATAEPAAGIATAGAGTGIATVGATAADGPA